MTRRVYGLHAVTTLIERHAGQVQALWLDSRRDDQRLRRLAELAQAHGLRAQTVARAELDRLAEGASHQGAVAQVSAPAARNETFLEQLLVDLRESAFLLVLDGVQDPHNLGACLRSADAAGVHALVVPRDRACGLTPVVAKVASGAAESVPFVQVTNLARTLRSLQDAGVRVVGAAAGEGSTDLFATDLTGPLALVLGAEGSGLRRLTREHCDALVAIPMLGTVESLNVSVAAGVCLFEALRQRR